MKPSRSSILLVTLVGVVAAGLMFSLIGHARKSAAQNTEKSLDIERYPKEPLELVDLQVSELSIKNMIVVRSRRDTEGLDNVRFSDTDEWFRRVWVRLRNIS